MTVNIRNNDGEYIIATFYRFSQITNPEDLKVTLLDLCRKKHIKGTILLASEGINATVAGKQDAVLTLIDCLKSIKGFSNLEIKVSYCTGIPFYRMKVKVREEIVTMGLSHIRPEDQTGKHLNAREWNKLLEDPDVLVIDTRNHYEHDIGTFPGAVSPDTDSFTEFPKYVQENLAGSENRKIAMFCTGGIRCEKASSYLLEQGFRKVFQLQGGILQYLEDVTAEDNRWQGECFVFDQRVAVNSDLRKGQHVLCYACRMPVSPQDMKSEEYLEGISCPRCYESLTDEKRRNLAERQKQVNLAKDRNRQHIGIPLEK